MKPDYAVQLIWSEEDEAYLAITAELPGCIADGKTQEEALANVKVAIVEWIEVAMAEKRPIPPPLNVQTQADLQQNGMLNLQKQIESQVRQAIEAIVQQLSQSPPAQSAWGTRGGMQFHHASDLPGKR